MKVEEAIAKTLKTESHERIQEEIEKAEELGVFLIPYGNEFYPKPLIEIHDPPPLLYVWGERVDALNKFSIAVVGSRKATSYGKAVASQIAGELAKNDVVIVSGLAYGIDSTAHAAAVKKGITVAVLGNGIDVVYPHANVKLFEEVKKHGCLVSEFPFGTKPNKWTFPRRNRIIAGLSMGTVVIEAAKRSGSLITARLALEEGREVFAVPGSIFSSSSEGTNELIKRGAKCVTCTNDVLEEFEYVKVVQKDERTDDPIVKSLKNGPKTVEEISHSVKMSMDELNVKLTMLEINGDIEYDPTGKFRLIQ